MSPSEGKVRKHISVSVISLRKKETAPKFSVQIYHNERKNTLRFSYLILSNAIFTSDIFSTFNEKIHHLFPYSSVAGVRRLLLTHWIHSVTGNMSLLAGFACKQNINLPIRKRNTVRVFVCACMRICIRVCEFVCRAMAAW